MVWRPFRCPASIASFSHSIAILRLVGVGLQRARADQATSACWRRGHLTGMPGRPRPASDYSDDVRPGKVQAFPSRRHCPSPRLPVSGSPRDPSRDGGSGSAPDGRPARRTPGSAWEACRVSPETCPRFPTGIWAPGRGGGALTHHPAAGIRSGK